MLNTFRYEPDPQTAYGVAHFTDAGRKAVDRYSRYYEALFRLLASHFPRMHTCRPPFTLCLPSCPRKASTLSARRRRAVRMRRCGRPDGQRLPASQDPNFQAERNMNCDADYHKKSTA